MTSPAIKPMNVVQLANALRDSSHRFDMFETMAQTGWLTNGRFMFRAPDSLATRILSRRKPDADRPTRIIDSGRMAQICEVRNAQPVESESDAGVNREGKAVVVMRTAGRRAVVDAVYLATVRKYQPDADAEMSAFANTPILFRANGVVVALIMPTAE